MATAARALSTFNATWSSWATLSSSAFRPVFSVSTRPTKSPAETRPRRNPTFFHSLMRSGISTMAFLLFSILSRQVSKPPPELPRHPPPADQRKDVLCNHVPLVLVTLDLLPNTRALDAQALSDPLLQPHVRLLLGIGQELLDTVLARQLGQIRLPSQRVLGIVPLVGYGVPLEAERVPRFLLVGCDELWACEWEDFRRGVAGEECPQPRGQRERQFDVCRRHGAGGRGVRLGAVVGVVQLGGSKKLMVAVAGPAPATLTLEASCRRQDLELHSESGSPLQQIQARQELDPTLNISPSHHSIDIFV